MPPRLAYIPNSFLATIVIQQNHCPSIVNVTNLSNFPMRKNIYVIIYLTSLNSKKNIEEMYLDFMKNVTDNLDPDGLDILNLPNNGTILVINEELTKVIYDISNDIIKKF